MFKKFSAAVFAASIITTPAFAHDEHEHGDAAVAQKFIKTIMSTEAKYARRHGGRFFQNLAKGQHPRATVVTCSDSRVQSNMLEKHPKATCSWCAISATRSPPPPARSNTE